MSALEIWRRQMRPLIPRGFLRRDQGEGLLISDFPRFHVPGVEEALNRAGFCVCCQEGMARIDGTLEKYRELAESLLMEEIAISADNTLPLWALGKRLARHAAPLEQQPMDEIRLTLKCLDAGDTEALLRLLPARIALLQRRKAPLPALAGQLILDHLAKK